MFRKLLTTYEVTMPMFVIGSCIIAMGICVSIGKEIEDRQTNRLLLKVMEERDGFQAKYNKAQGQVNILTWEKETLIQGIDNHRKYLSGK